MIDTRAVLRRYLGARVDAWGVVHLVANLPKMWLTTNGCLLSLRGSKKTDRAITCLRCAARGHVDIARWIDSMTDTDIDEWGLAAEWGYH